MKVKWSTCEGGRWCTFNGVPLEDPYFTGLIGVYFIWAVNEKGKVPLIVGSGMLREQLKQKRSDPSVQIYEFKNTLYCTWAEIAEPSLREVESTLIRHYQPKMNGKYIPAESVRLNTPW